jgi:hypothetical protein
VKALFATYFTIFRRNRYYPQREGRITVLRPEYGSDGGLLCVICNLGLLDSINVGDFSAYQKSLEIRSVNDPLDNAFRIPRPDSLAFAISNPWIF